MWGDYDDISAERDSVLGGAVLSARFYDNKCDPDGIFAASSTGFADCVHDRACRVRGAILSEKGICDSQCGRNCLPKRGEAAVVLCLGGYERTAYWKPVPESVRRNHSKE